MSSDHRTHGGSAPNSLETLYAENNRGDNGLFTRPRWNEKSREVPIMDCYGRVLNGDGNKRKKIITRPLTQSMGIHNGAWGVNVLFAIAKGEVLKD